MRLTCPNCGAEYEVPDEVIPTEGRDVQCSNCGDTWFQTHSSAPVLDEEDLADDDPADEAEAHVGQAPAAEAPRRPEPREASDKPSTPEPATRRNLDPDIAGILKEEARMEAELRAGEARSGLESQPDLGLDDLPEEPERRAREARDRMARMRGEDPTAVPSTDQESLLGSRRDLLPDIEEINSSLRSKQGTGEHNQVAAPVAAPVRKKSGFSRGFAVAAIIVIVLALIYANAPDIARQVPAADPALNAYVTVVDQARLWLDNKLGEFVPK
jgi:predicted Zn finger-like uncharacterized protein